MFIFIASVLFIVIDTRHVDKLHVLPPNPACESGCTGRGLVNEGFSSKFRSIFSDHHRDDHFRTAVFRVVGSQA